MNKPPVRSLLQFKASFEGACALAGKRHFMTYYLIAAHPGCTLGHMERLKGFLSSALKMVPEQIQIFTPTPATISSTLYYCETDMAGKKIFCEKSLQGRQKQKDIVRRAAKTRSG